MASGSPDWTTVVTGPGGTPIGAPPPQMFQLPANVDLTTAPQVLITTADLAVGTYWAVLTVNYSVAQPDTAQVFVLAGTATLDFPTLDWTIDLVAGTTGSALTVSAGGLLVITAPGTLVVEGAVGTTDDSIILGANPTVVDGTNLMLQGPYTV